MTTTPTDHLWRHFTAAGAPENEMWHGLADLDRRQLALYGRGLCFGGPEAGEELRRLLREWLKLGRPGVERLVMEAYPRDRWDRPAADGEWAGVVEKGHAWFRWRYRSA